MPMHTDKGAIVRDEDEFFRRLNRRAEIRVIADKTSAENAVVRILPRRYVWRKHV